MAYCVNCGKELSAQAVMCPHCGHPGPATQASKTAVRTGGQELAGWGSRAGALILDGLVLVVPFIILMATLFATLDIDWQTLIESDDPISEGVITAGDVSALAAIAVSFLAWFIISALYKPLMEGRNGQTLGKMWVRIRVVQAAGGGRITMGAAFLRWLISWLLGVVSPLNLVNYLWPLWDDNNQTLHDKAAKTIVVKV